MRSPRLPAVLIIAASLAGGLVLQADDDRPEPRLTTRAGPPGVVMPAARPAGSLASTWYCAGGTGRADSIADHTVIIQNPSDEPRLATVTVLGGEVAAPLPEQASGDASATTASTSAPDATTTTAAPLAIPEPQVQQVEVPARSRVDLLLREVLEGQLVSAIVEVDGGAVAVEHTVVGDLGRSTAPCSTTASQEWSFAWGSTARGNRELLVFMNPFPEPATIDITFATDEGTRETRRFEGFPVPARSVVGAFIDQDVQRKNQVSAQIELRSGRVVVDRIQILRREDGRRGITLGLGAPTPAEVWVFPDGQTGQGLGEQVVLFNPSEEVAEVEVAVRPQDVDAAGMPEPFAVTVPPHRYAALDLHSEDRVPRDQAHAIFVRSLNGVPVVAERVSWAVEGADRRGTSATLGSPLGATRWLLPAGSATDEVDEWLTLVNLAEEEATVTVTAFGDGQPIAVQDLQGVAVPAQGRLTVRLGSKIERATLPLLVEADRPIVVERGLYRVGGLGMSNSIAIPFSDDVVVPEPLG